MINNLNKIIYLVVFATFSLTSIAGSYEDFFTAIKRDNAAGVVTLLQRGFDPNTRNPEGVPGLLLAMREPSLKVVDALIAWPKTEVEVRSAQDESPLMLAALKGFFPMAKKLVERGADVNKTGWAPLHYAATGGHVEIIDLLLENHAYIDAESPNGTTPLMMAAQYGTPAAVKKLLEAGADVGLRNQIGLTALDFAQRASRKDAAELLSSFQRSQQPRGKW